MLVDYSPDPPPSPVVVSTNSRRNEDSISSIENTKTLVGDQVLNQHTLLLPLPFLVLLDMMYSF